MSPDRVEVAVDGHTISLANLDKVLFPSIGFTKGELLDYYARIAPVMLPHLRDRPLTLRRFPDGVAESSFFEKHVPSHAPSWVRTVEVPVSEREARRRGRQTIAYAVVNDLATLMWAANLATVEFHVPLWRATTPSPPAPPDHLVFDLDPGPGTSIVECCLVARALRDHLDERARAHLHAKTSGSKGLQLYLRLDRPLDWEELRREALDHATALERDQPSLVVTNMRKDLRKGRVLIDWSQNTAAKTTVAAYSLRATPDATVSTPVTWDEVEVCAAKGDAALLRFGSRDVLERVERLGDLFEDLAR